MSKRFKIFLFIFLVVIVFLIVKLVIYESTKLCGRCNQPVVPNTVSQINDYANLKIVHSSGNGSLPPPYYRSYTFTILTNSSGEIAGEYKVSDGRGKIFEKRALTISSEQLTNLIAVAAKINPKTDESVNSGCTGGIGKSLTISQNNNVLLEASAYNCAGKSSNDSLEKVSAQIERLLSDGKE